MTDTPVMTYDEIWWWLEYGSGPMPADVAEYLREQEEEEEERQWARWEAAEERDHFDDW